MSECRCQILRRGRAPADGPLWEQDCFIAFCDRHVEANVARLEARVRVLEEGLRMYGHHLYSCGCYGDCKGQQDHVCNCGLSTLLTTGGEK